MLPRNLVQPKKLKDLPLDEIVYILQAYYELKLLVIAERFRLRRYAQKNGATVAQFAAELKQLSTRCDFGDRLDEALRDSFVSGIQNESCQRKLLSTDGLTFARVLEIALKMKAAHRDTLQLRQSEPTATSVHKVNEKQKFSQPAGYRCKGKNHSASDCYFKTTKCHKCDKVGHIQQACRADEFATRGKRGKQVKNQQKATGYVQAEDANVDAEMFCINEMNKQAFKVNFAINQRNVLMEIDTGAADSIISEARYKKTFAHVPLGGSNVTLKTYTGQTIPVRGQFLAKVAYRNQSADLPLIVVKGDGLSLFGRNWLENIKLDWKAIKNVSENTKQPYPPKSISEVLEKYRQVFKDGLGTLKDIKATISVKPNATPKFHKSHPLPFAMKL